MSERSERDVAVQIANKIFRQLFQRTWLPWTATHDRAVERLVDAIINAASEQREINVEQELAELTGGQVDIDDGMKQFREWQRRRAM